MTKRLLHSGLAGLHRRRRAAFLPEDVPGLVARWDASWAGSITAAGDHPTGNGLSVSEWVDAYNGNTLVAHSAGREAGYGVLDGRYGLWFDNNYTNPDTLADCMQDLSPHASLVTLPLTIAVVCRRVREGGFFDRVLHLGSNSTNQGITFSFSNSSELMRVVIGTGAASTTYNAGTGVAAGSVYIATVASGAVATWCNGTAGDTGTATANFGSSQQIAVAWLPGPAPFKGQIFEIIIIGGVIGAADRQKLEGYLAHKWRTASLLPSSHPYRISTP